MRARNLCKYTPRCIWKRQRDGAAMIMEMDVYQIPLNAFVAKAIYTFTAVKRIVTRP